ncbi:MAG: hypothetical protein JWO69_1616 [Thermoleophilia bacterium]|jgi:hypothetical protein|nr:hypothetical protein [Thermoleophilia bacterium]
MRNPRRLRSTVTYANVVATVALMVAVSGTAYGVSTLGSGSITDGSVRSIDIANNTVASVDVRSGGIGKLDLTPQVAAGVGATPVAVHTEDVHPGSGYTLSGQDFATSTLKLPSSGGPWLIDMTAEFTPTTNNAETVVACLFLVDGKIDGLPMGEETDRNSALRMVFREARQVSAGTHTIVVRCTAAGDVVVPQVDLTAIAYRLPKA